MSDYNLGTATGKIVVDYDDRGSKKADKDLEQLGTTAKKTSVSSDKMARGLGAAGAIIAGGLAVAVNSAANFEQRLSAIKAVSGATADEMEKVRAKALQIGKDTAFSATEAATAMEELLKAGLTTTDVLNGAADATVALAAAGEIDLPKAAEISANAMNQFNLAASDMPRIADLIAGAANASAIDVKEFGFSLSQVGAVANLAGLSFEDTAVAIAEMGNAGIKGSDAGTSLKTMLSNLQPGTVKQTKLFKELGLMTEDGSNKFFDQEGKLKSLRDIQQILNTSLKDMTSQQKQATLETLFGSDAIRAAAVLSDEGAAGYTKMADAMGKVKAADVAATKLDNLKGSIEQLKGSSETLAIQLGTLLLPYIRDIVDAANELVGWFSALSPETQKVAVNIALAAASLLLFSAGTIKVVKFFSELKTALQVIGGLRFIAPVLTALRVAFLAVTTAVKAFTLALVTNPIGLIIIAIIALVVVIVLLWKNSETFRDIVTAVWQAVWDVIKGVIDWFTGTAAPAVMSAIQSIIGFFQMLWASVVTVWNAILTTIQTVFTAIANVIITVISTIWSIWTGFWNGPFGQIIKGVFELIVLIITVALALVLVVITRTLDLLFKIWQTTWELVTAVLKAAWTVIKTVVTTFVTAIKTVIMTFLSVLKTIWTAAWNVVKTVVSAAWGVIKSVVSAGIGVVKSVVSAGVGVVKSVVSKAWDGVKSVTKSVWESEFGQSVRRGIRVAVELVRSLGGIVKNALSGAGRWLVDAGRRIIQGLIDGIQSAIGRVRDLLGSVTNLIPDWKGPKERDEKLLTENGALIMQSLIGGLASQLGPLRSMLQGVTADIPSSFVDPRLASDTVRRSTSTTEPAPGATTNVEVNNYNPIAEPDSVSTTKSLTRLAQLGVLG